MAKSPKGTWVTIGGKPVDLNSGMIEAVTDPPTGYVSRFQFEPTDVAARIQAIDWFSKCGEALALQLSVPIERVTSWAEAVQASAASAWEHATLEARNQLTLWLHLNALDAYRRWNEITVEHKSKTINVLTDTCLTPFVSAHALPQRIVRCVQWDVLAALMENSYLPTGHRSFFFLELLKVYEVGHFPCGWRGDWPAGHLLVF
ncbi:MAG: hypothetical protein JST54_34080 [Deltaproteobacteria bacterium]|nr:hypothetical protein [Deltaproteobacteria bacterium]